MLNADLSRLLVRELTTVQREIQMFPDDESIWKTMPGVSNSAGNLGMHLAGNVQHFIGAILGETGYVRDRETEFNARSGSRADVVAQLAAACDAATRTFAKLTPADFDREFPLEVGGVKMKNAIFLMHLCSHAAFHLGQIDYLRRIAMADPRTADTVALKPLA